MILKEAGAKAQAATMPADKTPRTERGRRTLRAILDAAAAEFGERGYHDAGISRITQRAGVALGTFYTYFDSKEAVFTALVRDLSGQVRDHVAPAVLAAPDAMAAEAEGLRSFLGFVRAHKEIYRIIDEAEFVDQASFRDHYRTSVDRIAKRLAKGVERGELRKDVSEIEAWAIVGMNVFLGLRYGVWSEAEEIDAVVAAANGLLRRGLAA